METSGCVDNNNIAFSCLCRFKSVINYSSRIRTLGVLYDINTGTFCPYLKLIYSGCTECIRCRNKNLFLFLFELVTELSYSSRLSGAVYADNHDNCRRLCEIKTCIITHDLADYLLNKLHYIIRIGDSPLLDLFTEPVAYFKRCFNADIAHYHSFFKFLEKLLVYLCKGIEYPFQSAKKACLCLFKTGCNFCYNSHNYSQSAALCDVNHQTNYSTEAVSS